MMNKERWKDIEGYEGLYMVSDMGRVKSCKRYVKCRHHQRLVKERVLQSAQSGKYGQGVVVVALSRECTLKTFIVSRLVYSAFKGDVAGLLVSHKNYNSGDNNLLNLTTSIDNSESFQKNANNTYKYIGYRKESLRFSVILQVYRDKKSIIYDQKSFSTELEAAKYYDECIIKYNLKRKGNFIDNRKNT